MEPLNEKSQIAQEYGLLPADARQQWIDPFFRLNEQHFSLYLRKNILVRLLTVNMKNCLTLKKSDMWDPILVHVTLWKTRPHYSQSGRENVTPSSGTSPLASYKEVPPRSFTHIQNNPVLSFFANCQFAIYFSVCTKSTDCCCCCVNSVMKTVISIKFHHGTLTIIGSGDFCRHNIKTWKCFKKC